MYPSTTTTHPTNAKMAERHVSRWRLPTPTRVAGSDGSSESEEARAGGAVSLRYLDEFVRKLQCAPRLLEHQLFPDAKEITESMGLFNAVRRYVITSDSDTRDGIVSSDGLADGIIVVGDGNTPRSAAMFAFRLKQWKCYSIDPAMERHDASTSSTSARAQGWTTIENLVVVRNKIENVHIKLRRAVVVLVHAHVTLTQALGAVECEELVGVVTMPCCNWYGKQEELFGKPPSIVYDDFSILSDHRELRVWLDPRGDRASVSVELAVDESSTMAKGCVRKTFVADYVPSKAHKQIKKEATTSQHKKQQAVRTTSLFHELLCDTTPSTRPNAMAAIATLAQSEAIATHVESILQKHAARVLLLTGDCSPQESDVARSLLQRGFSNVFALRSASMNDIVDVQRHDPDVMEVEVIQLEVSTSASSVACTGVTSLSCKASEDGIYEVIATNDDQPFRLFDCIFDVGFIHRSLRNQPKKTCGAMFQRVVQFALCLTATPEDDTSVRLITVSPRKDWRKAEFLASDGLGLEFSTKSITADMASSSSLLYVYACRDTGRHASPSLADHADEDVAQAQKKQVALQLKQDLESDFASHVADQQLPLVSFDEAKAAADPTAVASRRVRVRGIVKHQRRFTTGPSFFSVAPLDTRVSSFRDNLQVSMDPERLAQWNAGITLDAVFRLLHKSDRVECVGEMKLNAQQQPMLQLDALRFLESEFQTYQ